VTELCQFDAKTLCAVVGTKLFTGSLHRGDDAIYWASRLLDKSFRLLLAKENKAKRFNRQETTIDRDECSSIE
jgi:hypothetical protein